MDVIAKDLVPTDLPGALLFTTRSGELYDFKPIQLDVLPQKAALALLLRHPRRHPILQESHRDHETAKAICQMVGCLPLALEVAGAELGNRRALKLDAYWRTLQKFGALSEVGERTDEAKKSQHPGLNAVLMEQWHRLPNDEARQLLAVEAHFGEAEQLPVARLGMMARLPQEADTKEVTLPKALYELSQASLMELLDSQDTQHREPDLLKRVENPTLTIRLHPLVREFVAGLFDREEPSSTDDPLSLNTHPFRACVLKTWWMGTKILPRWRPRRWRGVCTRCWLIYWRG